MTVSAADSTFLENFPNLAAAKLAHQGTSNQDNTAPANGSRAAIMQYLLNLCSPSECTAGIF